MAARSMPGASADTPQDVVHVGEALSRRGDAAVGIDPDRGRARRLEAHLHFEHADEAADQEAGADQQDAGECDLRHDQRVADEGPFAAPGGSAARVLERAGHARPRRLQRRRQAEDDAGDQRDADGEHERGPVSAHVAQQRDADRIELGQQARAGDREREAEDGAARREDEAFREHLSQQPLPPGAERHPDRDFLLSRRRACEQQVRQVGADDQHDHPHGAGEHQDGEPDVAADVLGQRLDDALEAVALRMLTTHQRREHADFGLRLAAVAPGLSRPIIAIVLPQRLVSGLSGNGK